MPPAFKNIALIGRYKSKEVARPITALGKFLETHNCGVLVDSATAEASGVRRFPVADYAAIGRQADLAVVLGGDGSMLSAARALAPYRVPLLGVNRGRLGFMTDVTLGTMRRAVSDVIAGKYSSEDRTMLAVELHRGKRRVLASTALNDVVVSKGGVGRLIELEVRIDGQFVYDMRSDGLITATPTGSTAYALSSGGPILHPRMAAFALVPISPHTLSNRPIALYDRANIEIILRQAQEARLHLDGQPFGDLAPGDRVLICRARRPVRFIHPAGYDYFSMLRGKLHWTESPL
ncbi:MAG: NAD kinase [Burkholderiales bacterium]